MNDLLKEAQKNREKLVARRRDFHQNPELGFQEKRSAGIIAEELKKLGLEIQTGVAETGVVGIVEGAKPGKVVLLRFDMDALPVQEETGASYQSKVPGKMHACGHDAHMAIGLTVAEMLANEKQSLHGTVKLVFQPAEEGAGGAERMVREGVLENPKPDFALGMHVWNERPLKWLGITSGPIMAGADFFEIQIIGQGGHGAIPEKTADPIVAAAQIITALQTIVSRNISPRDTAVVSITRVHGGDAYNVIPGCVELRGTIRSFKKEVHDQLVKRIEELAGGIAASMNCTAKTIWIMSDPPLVNDAAVTNVVAEAARQLLPDHTVDSDHQSMGSEDMAYILEKIPGCYVFLGSMNQEKNLVYGHHHPKFDFDEDVLPVAAALVTACTLRLLESS